MVCLLLLIVMGCTPPPSRCEILVLVGSARQESVNAGLAQEMRGFAISPRTEVKLSFPSLDRLPLFNTDLEKNLCTSGGSQSCRRRSRSCVGRLLLSML